VLHHRGPDFREVMKRCLGRLQEVARTQNDVLLFTASGTGAFESAVVNLLSPGERVLVVTAGEFGDRWIALARAYAADVQELRYAWGETPHPDDLRGRLEETGADVVFLVHSETSTGVVSDAQAIAAAAIEAGALVVVDAVSSLGAVPLETDAWGIDVAVAGSQKALMAPPGLGIVAVSPAALAATGPTPRFYFDWRRTLEGQAKLDAPFTPAISIVRALNVALRMILEEGLEAAFARHVRLGRACRQGIKAMGLELASPDEDRSAVVTTVRAPEGLDVKAFLLDLRDRLGVQLIGGQGEWSGAVFRIGHIGYFDLFDITTALAAVEDGLVAAGIEIERGAAVSAALRAFEQTPA
nr:alanine--glyoxylate aminotransferase family protein [Actinomycetota bacterium]